MMRRKSPPAYHEPTKAERSRDDWILGTLMRVILDVIEGPRKGRSFVFERHDTFLVGRSQFAHCSMPEDLALSRDHFLIEINPPRCEIRDLGSTNGTFVNERPIERGRLSPGDRIMAGQSVFLVRMEGAASSRDSSESWEERFRPSRAQGASTMVAPTLASLRITCAGCGQLAPPGIDVASSGSGADLSESIHWICGSCRAEAAETPQPVPQFNTLRELGRGAMGIVYLAKNIETGRKVALKLIAPETAAARSAIDRFLREMNVVSQLKHPNIVEFYEQGTTRGRFWFAMEYVDGVNLETLAMLDPGRYPVNQACRMACQVLKGLEHAHMRGFVHRDIKPENILIGRGGNTLQAKISDFGLAKSFRSIGLSALTFSGEMRGTIPFMPPEQMLDFKTVLPSGDLYSTAATLYFLITGKYIYDQTDGVDPVRLLLEEPPVPISERRKDVAPALGKVLERCLARDPLERYPDATSMRDALRPFC
jgi:serine/threonine-protein kinase